MKLIKKFIPFVILTTAFCGLVFVAVHQSIRQNANDPQIQMSEDSARLLENGEKPEDVTPKAEVDISKSLSVFLIIFDDQGKPVASSAVLKGRIPSPPMGVFDNVRSKGKGRLTWEPSPGIRIAAVITKYNGANPGFVLAGRSIREVEAREHTLFVEVAAAWVGTLVVSFIATALFLL